MTGEALLQCIQQQDSSSKYENKIKNICYILIWTCKKYFMVSTSLDLAIVNQGKDRYDG